MLGWSLGLVGLVAVVMVGQSASLFGSAPTGPERLQVDPAQVAVVDGDTLRLGTRVIRLSGITAPDRGDTCRAAGDCAAAATRMLAALVRDRRLDCRLSGHDEMGRPFGACDANGIDLSTAAVSSGWVRVRADEPALARLERQAREQGAGLWADPARR